MDKFWSLFQESVIVQAILTLVIWGTIAYMTATGQEVPDGMMTAGQVILGFFFGAKVPAAAARARAAYNG